MLVSTRFRALAGTTVAAIGVFSLGGGLALMGSATGATPSGIGTKDYVCKYVGTPGDDERLQTGKNPIWVATDFPQGSFFNDAQGRSFVLIADTPRLDPEPDASACPAPGGGPTDPTTGPTDPTTDPTDPTTDPTDPTTDPTDPTTDPTDPTTDPTDPTTDPTDPTTDPTDPTGSIDPQPGGVPTPTATHDTESPTGVVVPAGGQVPSSHAVPTAVAAGLAAAPVVDGSDRAQLGRLLALLGALCAVAGAAIALTGRPRGEHQF